MINNSNNTDDNLHLAICLKNDLEEMRSYDTETAYRRSVVIRNALTKESKVHRLYYLYSRVAAILLLPLIGLSFMLAYIFIDSIKKENTSWVEVTSAPGLISKIQLPDSSWVWLNSGSKIKYPSQFKGKKRTVQLYGEGLFDVKSDLEHPFYVQLSNGIKVMAHGTRFNITSYKNDSLIETTLLRGKVDLLTDRGSIRINPSQKIMYNKNSGKSFLKKVDTEETTDWTDGKILFRNTSVEDAIRKISRRHNVEISFTNNTGRDYYLRANFTYENAAQILGYLQMIIPLKWNVIQKTSADGRLDNKYKYNVWIE